MMHVGGVLVYIAEISIILYVNCGMYPFRIGISFFEILTLSPTLNFSFLYLVRGFLYRIQRKLVFLTSLVDFPKDLLTRHFLVETIRGNL